MTHVRIECLTAGQSQEHAAEHEEERKRTGGRKANRFKGIERVEDRRRRPDIDDAEHGDGDEPDHHHRSKQPADAAGSAVLKSER